MEAEGCDSPPSPRPYLPLTQDLQETSGKGGLFLFFFGRHRIEGGARDRKRPLLVPEGSHSFSVLKTPFSLPTLGLSIHLLALSFLSKACSAFDHGINVSSSGKSSLTALARLFSSHSLHSTLYFSFITLITV